MSESKGQIKGHFKIFLGYFSFMLSFAFTLSFCICFTVDIHSVTSYFEVQYPRVWLEVIAGAIHASYCTVSSFDKNECNIKYINSNLVVVYYGTLRKVEKLTCDTLINRIVHAIIGPRRNKVENKQGLKQTHYLLLKAVYLEMIKGTQCD